MSGNLAIEQVQTKQPHSMSVFGLDISDLDRDSAIAELLADIQQRRHRKIAFCNAHTANLAWSDAALRDSLSRFAVFADGIGVDIAARVLHGRPFAANLNGTDFVPALLSAETRKLRIAMLGARPQVAERAAAVLSASVPQHEIGVPLHGYADDAETEAFLDGLKRSPADILLVAMGNPLQERWIAERITQQHATLAIGVGALFDFLAGEVPRAPPWVRQLRMEWIYRLAQEPKRLFRRYVLGNPLFLLRVAMVRFGLRQA